VALLALAVGALPAIAPAKVVLALCGVIAAGIAIAVARHRLTQPRVAAPVAEEASERDLEDRGDVLRWPRILYYLGMLFVGLLALRPLGGVPISDLFFLAALAAALAELALRRQMSGPALPLALLCGVLLYALGAIASAAASESPVASVAILIRVVYITAVWFWLGALVLRREEHLRMAMILWVTSIAISGAGAVIQQVFGDVIPGAAAPFAGRNSGFTQHVNDLGGSAGIAFIPALLLVTLGGPKGIWRLLRLSTVVLVAAGVILSGSVGGALAAAAGLVVWVSLGRMGTSEGAAVAAVGTVCLAVVVVLAGTEAQSPIDRLGDGSNAPGDVSTTLSLRAKTASTAWDRVQEQPFIGVGLDLASSSIPTATPDAAELQNFTVHNILLGAWYETGIIGLLGMLIMLGALFWIAWRTLLRARPGSEYLTALSLTAALTGFLTYAMGAPVLFQRYAWVAAALLLVLHTQQLRARGTAHAGVRAGVTVSRPASHVA
jgi:O-antigen ligase